MHQIYSCSDENLEVFTTVISSKSCSPARRKAKSTQHILTKRVVAVSDYRPYRTDDLLPRQGDHTQVLYKDEMRNFGRLQNGQQEFCPARCVAKHMGISEQESSKSCDNQSDGQSSKPSASLVTHTMLKRTAATEPATQDSAFAEDSHRSHSRKNTEHDLTLAPGADASLPLTGNNLCGTPGILRKMWMKHKKKSEYLGATNSAFEAD
ncbi:vexin [Emydura macquarii macquarii]|uniref:vexin n=1 Tax=Emydura macquarii macquarii TaxID=1129001 RepID=UPI00352B485F